MRRLCAQLIIAGVTAFAIGVTYRYAWDDPSEASFANLYAQRCARDGTGGKRLGSPPLFQFAAQRVVATVAAPRGNCVPSSGDGNRRLSNCSGLTGGSL